MTIWGRNRLMMATTSLRIESRGQKRNVSSALLEKPQSYARVKYWRAPSNSRAASSSSVRITPSSGPSSGPIRFCPPSPRLSDKYATCAPIPRASSTSSCVSSSSGCAPIIRTRLFLPSCRRVVANAATPPVPAGASCARPTPAAPILRKSATPSALTLLGKANDAALHDELDPLEFRDIARRITRDSDDVRIQSGRKRADVLFLSEQRGGDGSS